jgi:hypothetical protein
MISESGCPGILAESNESYKPLNWYVTRVDTRVSVRRDTENGRGPSLRRAGAMQM